MLQVQQGASARNCQAMSRRSALKAGFLGLAFVLQAGADYMLTPNWGVFVDGKKVFFETDSGGMAQNPVTGFFNIPTRAHVRVDPWVAAAGITFKY